jgi:hypothetical protein
VYAEYLTDEGEIEVIDRRAEYGMEDIPVDAVKPHRKG